jgi:hypothetical protein
MVRWNDALERGLDHRSWRGRDDVEREAILVGTDLETFDEALDVFLQSHLLPRLDQMLAADAPELGIAAKEVCELRPLLHEVISERPATFSRKFDTPISSLRTSPESLKLNVWSKSLAMR